MTYPKVFKAQSIEVNLIPPAFFFPSVITLKPTLTNHGKTETFILEANDKQGYITRVAPASIKVNKGQTTKFAVDVTVPSSVEDFSEIEFTIKATSANDPQSTNSVSRSIMVMIPPTLTVPPDITVGSTGPLTQVEIGTATSIKKENVAMFKNDAPKEGFPFGKTVVKWTAIGMSGLSTTASQTVTVTP